MPPSAPAPARSVSIVLPVHNQGDHIADVVGGYVSALAGLPAPWDIILVPNACTDDTAAICRALAEANPAIRVVELPQGGWGRSVKAGIAAARGDLICYTNSARTTPAVLMLLLLYALSHPDVVLKANRRVRESWRRRLGSLLYNLESRALFDLSVWDVNGTPKVFSRNLEPLMTLESDDDLIDLEFNVRCRIEGYPVLEVPVLAGTRRGGRSTTGYGSAVRMYVGAWRLSRRLRVPRDASR